MIRAELRHISPNDYQNWEEFAAVEHPQPWDEFGWFILDIGAEGEAGTTLFQALVTTPAAKGRAKENERDRRMLVVPSFEPEDLARELREYVGSVTGSSWSDVVEQLRCTMYWEYERRFS